MHIGSPSRYFPSGSDNASPGLVSGGAGNTPDDDDSDSTESSSSSLSSSSSQLYYDYRANLRSSLLVAQHTTRLRAVEDDMDRFMRYLNYELGVVQKELGAAVEQDRGFTLHAHDLSLANIFVDEEEHSKIVRY